jgi:hypothetical protein
MRDMSRSRRRRYVMAILAAASALGVGLSALVANSQWGARLDEHVQNVFSAPLGSRFWQLAFNVDDLLKTVVILGGCLACAVAFVCRGSRTAISIGASIVIAGAIAELLKHSASVAPASRALAPSGPSWPSVHASALAALGAAVQLLPRARMSRMVVAAFGAVGLGLAGVFLMTIRAHEPADLVGGSLVGLCVFATVAAVLDPRSDRRGTGS